MKKLTKEQLKERDALVSRLRDRRSDLETVLETYNAAVETAWGLVESAQTDFNDVIAEASEWMSNISSDIDEYTSGRSEKWQESDKASLYSNWKDAFDADLEEAEFEKPDDFELNIEDSAEVLEQLPEEVEE